MKRAHASTLKIDVMVDSKRWKEPAKAKAVVRRAIAQAAAATRSTTRAELAIVLTDDSAIRALNRDWRGIDKATNVLSFPTKNAGPEAAHGAGHAGHGPDGPQPHLGDIVLAFETIEREAEGERKPLTHHLAHLAVHGFLHLVGYDHERDKDARKMEQAERDILRQLKIPDPYRGQPAAKKPLPRRAKAS
jgi:probable rRNA maturation factor